MYLQVTEGTAFFNSALERITTIQDKVRDLTTARAIEREDFAAQLEEDNQRKAARQLEEENQRKLAAQLEEDNQRKLAAQLEEDNQRKLAAQLEEDNQRKAAAARAASAAIVPPLAPLRSPPFAPHGGGGGGGGGGGEGVVAAGEAGLGNLAAEIRQLMEMGFSREQAAGDTREMWGRYGKIPLTPNP